MTAETADQCGSPAGAAITPATQENPAGATVPADTTVGTVAPDTTAAAGADDRQRSGAAAGAAGPANPGVLTTDAPGTAETTATPQRQQAGAAAGAAVPT